MKDGQSGGLHRARFDAGEPDLMMDINTTPLIDVMLVLLIMFIITIPVQLHAVNLNLPAGTPPPATREPVVVRVDVDFDGTILWNDQPLVGRDELDGKFRALAAPLNQDVVHVRANKLAEYRWVAQVLASAQRLGVTKLAIVGDAP